MCLVAQVLRDVRSEFVCLVGEAPPAHTGTRTARASVHSAHAQEIYMSPVARVGEIVLMLRFQKKKIPTYSTERARGGNQTDIETRVRVETPTC